MTVTVAEAFPSAKLRIEPTSPLTLEAGELKIPKGEVLGPGKLAVLGKQGYTIHHARPMKEGGFSLLLTRPVETKDRHVVQFGPVEYSDKDKSKSFDYETGESGGPSHINGPRCPDYCNCLSYEMAKKPPRGW